QPQLRALLAHPELAQLNQRITLRWHIGPLDREETMAYVRHRLEIASEGQVRDVFSRPALRSIHARSRGVPRLINMLCHRAMLAAFAAERRTVTLRSVRRAYREVTTLPLPGRPASPPRAVWTNAVLAVGVAGLAAGGGCRVAPPRPPGGRPAAPREAPRPAETPVRDPPPDAPAAAAAPAEAPAVAAAAAPQADGDPPPTKVASASAPGPASAPATDAPVGDPAPPPAAT